MSDFDRLYWEDFYKRGLAPVLPSNFALDCATDYIKDKSKAIIELGCGNLRDSIFFTELGFRVLSVDVQKVEVDNQSFDILGTFIQADFSSLQPIHKISDSVLGYVYSRFSLHSVDDSAAIRSIEWASKNLSENGMILIECRSQKDKCLPKYHGSSHKRYFRSIDTMTKWLYNAGFNILESSEGHFAPYKSENPVVIRLIGTKRN